MVWVRKLNINITKKKNIMTQSTKNNNNGRIPPQAIDLEESVIGSMLVNKDAVIEAMSLLFKDSFYKDVNGIIFDVMKKLFRKSIPIDIMSVITQLKKESLLEYVGGAFHISKLTNNVNYNGVEHYSRIILEKYIQREMIKNSSELIQKCYDETTDVFENLSEAFNHLNEISELTIKKNESTFGDIKSRVIQKGEDIHEGRIKPGIDTPIKNLTAKAGGWRGSEMIVLAARPGMGKTSFALKAAYEPAKSGVPTAIFSLEMSEDQLVSRLLSMEYKIDGKKFNTTGLNPDEIARMKGDMMDDLPLHIDDSSSMTIDEFTVKAKRLYNKFGIRMIVIDYLQLMSGDNKNREQEISKISRGVKKVAKELDIPIIALSQLSRSVETRGGSKRPLLSDLRESGAIEQDADMVMFIYRPEYYGETEWDDYNGDSCKKEAEYIVAKNRNGGLVRNRMGWVGDYTLFTDLIEDRLPRAIDPTFQNLMNDEEEDLPF
jgi:replicative DNA helicase